MDEPKDFGVESVPTETFRNGKERGIVGAPTVE